MSLSPPPSPLSSDDALDVAVLSPKSKVKALLATVEDDSDTESTGKGSVSGALKEVSKSNVLPDQNAAEIHDGSAVSGRTDESDRDVPVIVHGKVAWKLHNIPTTLRKASPPEDEGENLTARERLRRRLIRQTRHLGGADDDGAAQIQSEDELASASDIPEMEQEEHSRVPEQHDSKPLNDDGSPCGSPRNESSAPGSQSSRAVSDSESNCSKVPQVNNRFQELVAKKRAERQAREAEEEAKKNHRDDINSRSRLLTASEDDDSDADTHAGRRLTQQARPTRKASKKAIEEMNRETQRLDRNRQLAHEAKTKKKITKQSFLDRFKAAQQPCTEESVPIHSSSTVPTSAPVSDHEEITQMSSPPSSPVSISYAPKYAVVNAKTCGVRGVEGLDLDQTDEDLPNLDDVLAQKALLRDIEAQKDSASTKPLADGGPSRPNIGSKKPNTSIRDRLAGKRRISYRRAEESDSELDIVPVQRSRARLDAFQGKTQMKSNDRSLQTLRALAHLNSPPDKNVNRLFKGTMSLAELQASLRRQARQQAALERAEKIKELKEKGVLIQTNEERARDQAEVEDLLEKAQKEAVEIREKEKRTAKKKGNTDEDDKDALLDTSDDEDFKGSQENAEEEFSGSEEDESVEDDDEDESARNDINKLDKSDGFIIGEASEDEQDEAELEGEEADDEGEEEVNDHITDEESDAADVERLPGPRRRARGKIIADDDEDDDGSPECIDRSSNSMPIQNPLMPTISDPSKANNGMLGLTQAFAATMADSQTQDLQLTEQQDSVTLLGTLPEPDLPVYDADMVQDSQVQPESIQDHTNIVPEEIVLDFTQSQILHYDTQDQLRPTQDFELPDPSQDAGFALSSPVGRRFVTPVPSTVDTVILSPAVQPRGRLRRGKIPVAGDDDDEESVSKKVSEDASTLNAFDAMKKGTSRTKAQAAFDKNKSNAKEMVEEQAQESEDEYAGVGGASDDESGGDNDEEMQRMIDESEINVDEQQLAALHADKERALDSAAVSKLFKDLNSGALRRKRGAAGQGDLDFFSDSDDERAEARQRAKRKEFARMRKALLENENVGKIATDPKKMAFLRAIEDRDDEDDDAERLDFLVEANCDGGREEQSQQQEGTQEVPDSQVESVNPAEVAGQAAPASPAATGQKRKRPLQDSGPGVLNRSGPSKRQTKIAQKPATLAEIRESLSFLTETPESLETAAVLSPDDDISSGHSAGDEEEEGRRTEDWNADSDTENHAPDIGRDIDGGNIDDNTMKPPPKAIHKPAANIHDPQRRRRPNPNASVIDRLSLHRENSSSLSTIHNAAFPIPSLSTTTSSLTSKIPPLLLRATTSSLSMSMSLAANNKNNNNGHSGVTTTAGTTATATTERAAGGGGVVGPGLKRGGSKKSSILWQAREAERREVVGKVEERRRRERERVVERWKARRRGKGVGVGVSMGRGEESWG